MVGERTAGILNRITETKVNDVTCPKCGEIFGVEFISPVDGSFFNSIRNDGARKSGVRAIHTRIQRSLKCHYCGNKFLERRERR